MEKPVAAIEFGSKKMKLVVGYELNGQVYTIYSLVRPYGHAIECADIVNAASIAKVVEEIKSFVDQNMKMRIAVTEATLSLPPYGLQIFDNKQTTTVMAEDRKVSGLDMKNIYTMIRNCSHSICNSLVDVVPESFILSDGRAFARLPSGETSFSLTVASKVHTLPKKTNDEFCGLLLNQGIKVKKTIVAPFAAMTLLSTYPEVPSDYILVDMGSNITTVSLIGNRQLYESRYFEWGGDSITGKIIESFNINEGDAEKYKIMYGIDNREMNFKAPVCITKDQDGRDINHYNSDLNEIIKKELDIFVKQLESAISDLFITYDNDQSLKSLPLVLIGGASRLNGLVEYIEPKLINKQIITVLPKTLGARNATFTNCLGMILASARYQSEVEDSAPKVAQITRK